MSANAPYQTHSNTQNLYWSRLKQSDGKRKIKQDHANVAHTMNDLGLSNFRIQLSDAGFDIHNLMDALYAERSS